MRTIDGKNKIAKIKGERMMIVSKTTYWLKATTLALIAMLLIQFGNVLVLAQEPAHNTIWNQNDLDKIYQYMAKHYDKATRSWKLDNDFNSADQNIAQDIMVFTEQIKAIEEGPVGETSFSRILETATLVASLASRSFSTVVGELTISSLPKEYREDSKIFFSALMEITNIIVSSLRDAGDYKTAKAILSAKHIPLKSLGAIGFLIDSVINVGDLIDMYNTHCWVIEQVSTLTVEGSDTVKNIKNLIVNYEITAEQRGILYDIIEWGMKYICSFAGVAIFTKIGIAIGGAIADGLGIIAGAVIGAFIGNKAGEAVASWIATNIKKAWMESGKLLERIYDKFWRYYRQVHVGAKIIDIWTWTGNPLGEKGDNHILQTIPFDVIKVRIKNTGEFTETFAVSPYVKDGNWIIMHSGWLGNLEDLKNALVGDYQNVSVKTTLDPQQETIISFVVAPYGLPLVQNLPTFYPQSRVGFSLFLVNDDTLLKLMDTYAETFYSQDASPGAMFEILCRPDHPYYKPGESIIVDLKLQNTGTENAYDLQIYTYIAYFGKSPVFLDMTNISEMSGQGSNGEWKEVDVSWTIPSDTPIGAASIIVRVVGTDTSGGVVQEYTKVSIQNEVINIYKLELITPTTSAPANAGDPNNPMPIYVAVTGLPPRLVLERDPEFSVKIGAVFSPCQLVDSYLKPAGIYVLKVMSPHQAEGKYDLEITATFDSTTDMGTEPQSVQYTTAPPSEPIEKGLAWLRTSQYSDGSWRSSVGVTALCTLAFLNAGYDETDPDVNQAIQYILSKAQTDGSIYVALNSREYETSLAILALVATHNDLYRTIIEKARNWLVNSQWDENCLWGNVSKDSWYYGGFGYGTGSRPDLSNTQFALLALDAAGLPKDDPTWIKAQVFLHRCQKVNFPITLNIEGTQYTVQPWNYTYTPEGYDGGFLYYPGENPYGAEYSMGSMTGAGIWGLLLSGVPKNDQRVTEAINWVINHYTWDTNYGCAGQRRYYYYLSMAKALTMYREKIIGGHDWYQELYNKIIDPTEMITVSADKVKWVPTTYEDYVPELPTTYAILSLQTRTAAPPVQRLSYLTFILRSNCFLRILDPDDNLVGYNYLTGIGENTIPSAIYSGPFSEPQYVVVVNPKPGAYRLELIGTSKGSYELTIQGNYGEEITDTFEYRREIRPAELHGSDLTVTAVVGPLDIYVNPPEFEEIIDN
ncbi:MAG: hypothetical protein ACPLYF_02905, partial [Fervidobacterium sp.]